MKHLLTILLFFFAANSFANDYYFANSGSDAGSGTTASPYQTITKANTLIAAGNKIYFKRGDTFYGTLNINASGTSGTPIVIGAYGTGAKPIIAGFTSVSSWTNLGGNIWESTTAVSTLPELNLVTIGGVNTAMGRYPNSGWLTYQTHNGNLSITSASLNSSTTDWTGAQVVLKKERWDSHVGEITSQSGGTLFYTDNGIDVPQNGYGFFIQSDSRTLDAQNEWYYTSGKKLQIYSTSSPTDVNVATLDSAMVITGNYITVQNVEFTGTNNSAVKIVNGDNIIIDSCVVSFAGDVGVFLQGSTGSLVKNSYIHHTNGNAIRTDANTTIEYNTVSNTSMIFGQVRTYSFGAITGSSGSLIQYNTVDSSGYNGIMLNGRTNSTVQNNFINNSCLLYEDGGGIYTSLSGSNTLIKDNIVLNTKGGEGGNNSSDNMAFGIYLDSYTTGTTVTGNTVSGSGGAGGFFSNLNDNVITNNTFYNNSQAGGFSAQSEVQVQHICCNTVTGNILSNNIYFVTNPSKYAIFLYSITNDIPSWFTAMDNNNFVSNGNYLVSAQINSSMTDRTLATWKTYTGKEASSVLVQQKDSTVRFEYNATDASKTVTLDAKYIDAKGVQLTTGSVVLPAYSSAVLIRNGNLVAVNPPPTVNAGPNVNISTDTTTLTGTATPASGQTITSTVWSKVSGGSAGITGAGSLTASVSGLTNGPYVFELKATQSDGQTATDQKSVSVLIPNIPPSVDAGPDQTITLPYTSLNGSVTPKDGETATYSWKFIQGTGTFSDSTILNPTVTNITFSKSILRLSALQSDGQSASDNMEINLNLPLPSTKTSRTSHKKITHINIP